MDNKAGRNIRIMGIVNITGDSFFAGSRMLASDGRLDEAVFRRRVEGMLGEGADILDFGACSTRPGSESVSEEEEWSRLEPALRIIARDYPGICLSVDTFRPGIVRKVYDLVGGFIVNDISGGCGAMWELLGELKVPYVAMHMRGTPATMSGLTDYPDGVTAAVMDFFEGIRAKADGNCFGKCLYSRLLAVLSWPACLARVSCTSRLGSLLRRPFRLPWPRISSPSGTGLTSFASTT